jgi:hypothetical protein
MNTVQSEPKQAPKPRGQRLSPELNEFLHMMKALETQFASQASSSTAN